MSALGAVSPPHLGPARKTARLRELAAVFLRLGLTAFGGPAAHIAMMEDEAVVRRQWLTRERFLDLLGVTNLLPGPSSSEMAIYLGYLRAGWAGLVIGGVCFVLPAALLVTALAWMYTRFGALPQSDAVLYGIRPVVVAIVAQAVWRLGRTAIKDVAAVVVGVAAAALSLAGLAPVEVLVISGVAIAIAHGLQRGRNGRMVGLIPISPLFATEAAGSSVTLTTLFLVFLKIGALVFGSGYVLLAFLRADLVERLHWLSERQLLDAVAVGQVTPGPVFTTATFIGYLLAGWTGAAVATLGIFLPAFLLVAVSGPFLGQLRQSPLVASIVDGVTVGSLALMGVVTWQLCRSAVVDLATTLVALASAILLLGFRVNSTWLIGAGAGLGTLLRVVRAH